MSRERYLIVGLGKTGTTAVAMTLANTLKIPDVLLEPKDLTTIERASAYERLIIKIVFDHWQAHADTLKAFVRPPVDDQAPTTIAIVRDPRDEAVSRLHYAAYAYFSTRPTTDEERAAWIEIFRRKEDKPDSIGLIDMQTEIKSRFGVGFLPGRSLYDAYCRFIDDIIDPRAHDVHLLRYEDFVHDAIPNEPLLTLLAGSHDVGPELRRVLRSGSSGDWQRFLTGQDLSIINSTCEPFLRRFEYAVDRTGRLGRPSRAASSDYVARLIDEARSLFDKGRLGAG
jgi:hypothetical protein